ncbi:hypothetical protein E5S70_15515 [Ensifer adhaerens]|nr:hypothetical protein [Ensifer canadensis]
MTGGGIRHVSETGGNVPKRSGGRSGHLLHGSLNPIRFEDKTCSNSKCYSDLCASDKTRGAVELQTASANFDRDISG